MSRYRGPRLRIVRRLKDLPGLTRKSPRRDYPPGQHGQNRKKLSEYAVRLQEKQKLRYNYGVTERQLLRYVRKAAASWVPQVKSCCNFWKCAWTIPYFGWGWLLQFQPPDNW